MSDLLTDRAAADYDAFADMDLPPPLTDTEAHVLIRRLARLADEKTALHANYEQLLRDLVREEAHVLAAEGGRLEAWAAAQLRGRKRSVRTLFGIAGFRSVPARWAVVDPGAALAWTREHQPEAIEERLDLRRLGKPETFARPNAETGEVEYLPPAGLEVVPERDVFYVKSGARAGGESDGD